MVEGRVQPGTGVMALIATLREIRCNVIRVRRALVILEMTRDASGAGQVVVVIDVAIGALPRWNSMHSCQRKSRRVVVERGV